MTDFKIFGGDSDLIKTRLYGLTQDAYIVTEERISIFNNYSYDYQVLISLFSIFLGATISTFPSYKINTTNTVIFYVCLVISILTLVFLFLFWRRFNKIKNNLFVKVESNKNKQTNASLRILKAIYGTTPTNSIDITDKIRSMVTDNKLLFIVSNEVNNGDDPQKGTRKSLTINYNFNDTIYTKKYLERETVNLP